MDRVERVLFQDVGDDRGRLTAIESGRHVPFDIARVFFVHGVVPDVDRGGHAHRDTDQVLSCVHGRMKVDVCDGRQVRSFLLDDAGSGILVPRMLWTRLYDFEDDAVLAVYANTIYDRSRSIRTWADYLDAVGVSATSAAAPGTALRLPSRAAVPYLLAESALADGGTHTLAAIDQWLTERRAASEFSVERVPLSRLRGWSVDPASGNLAHSSGKFFQVVGLEVQAETRALSTRRWSQPIINQPEIGILGFLAQRIEGVLHLLVQAKMEPGNVNLLQLSPTVQATRSNFTQVHGGTRPPYLDHFLDATPDRVVVDQLQSEQGTRFLRKRNRNVVVVLPDDARVEVGPDFRWMTLGQLRHMHQRDNMVNMDSRSVLGTLPYAGRRHAPGESTFAAAVRHSLGAPEIAAVHPLDWILRWLASLRTLHALRTRVVPLNSVPDWRLDGEAMRHVQGRYFEIIGVSVRASTREVSSWDQPLIQSTPGGISCLFCTTIGGVLHALVEARLEPGYVDVAELGPTTRFTPANYSTTEELPALARQFLAMPRDRIRYDGLQSEEGGRFYHDVNRYVVVELESASDVEPSPMHCWMTLGQLARLTAVPNTVNMELRSLLSCVGYGPPHPPASS